MSFKIDANLNAAPLSEGWERQKQQYTANIIAADAKSCSRDTDEVVESDGALQDL